ncbi:MAG: hypothetical protein EI684_01455 [Candidatus Viridilinea halotolerans]|uniref:NB-ARC domain-containing protein n=1 Tax=Candidatus Viridilinea halotolerans TaxID=2491704 RepID=A0A426UA97_9CHLR|nr:MAG: hypothetical protein EI684_01455 [Candidatus Viridilinea halotolerans]
MAPTRRNEAFGRLLSGAINSVATYEGKTAPRVEAELGDRLGVAGKTVQRYKAGYLPPDLAAVQLLAEMLTQRGYLGRAWLERFLASAHYPFAAQLVEQLCPSAPHGRPQPQRVYANLPAPTYSQFVPRPQAFAAVIEGLQQRTAAVLIVGLGGNGKTSLAREVAACALQVPAAPDLQFDAVVWISDKDRPGTTNLSVVLDVVARTLDYPALTQLSPGEKQDDVGQLLRRQRTLLVVDNVETITDQALLHWLLRLPEPSKALLTSRERHRALWGSWLVELRGMTDDEAQALLAQRLHALGLPVATASDLAPLVAVTGGNPKALAIALGLVKYARRTLPQVVDDLHAARSDLFADLFSRAWELLDDAARRLWLSLSLFPASAAAEALAATAEVNGYALDQALERLVDLSLLDVQQADLCLPPRYTLHSLVRAFAAARFAEEPTFAQHAARARWLHWYLAFADDAGASRYDQASFARFAPEQEGVFAAAVWAHQHGYPAEALALARKTNYFYYVRGSWDKNVVLNQIGAEAARTLADPRQELLMLAYSVQRLMMQDRLAEAAAQTAVMEARLATLELNDDDEVGHTVRHSLAFSALVRGQCAEAQALWEENLQRAAQLAKPTYHIITQLWLALAYQFQGRVAAAYELAERALVAAEQAGYTRGIIGIQLRLAALDLERQQPAIADQRMQAVAPIALAFEDRPNIARLRYLSGQLAALRGDPVTARSALIEAIDHYERLGLARELAEARRALLAVEDCC